jgi:hypothetical protein
MKDGTSQELWDPGFVADAHDDVDPGVRGALRQRRDLGDAQGIGVEVGEVPSSTVSNW